MYPNNKNDDKFNLKRKLDHATEKSDELFNSTKKLHIYDEVLLGEAKQLMKIFNVPDKLELVYTELLKNRDINNRIDYVANEILTNFNILDSSNSDSNNEFIDLLSTKSKNILAFNLPNTFVDLNPTTSYEKNKFSTTHLGLKTINHDDNFNYHIPSSNSSVKSTETFSKFNNNDPVIIDTINETDDVDKEAQFILTIFKDADPLYVRSRLIELSTEQNRSDILVNKMLNDKSYKLKMPQPINKIQKGTHEEMKVKTYVIEFFINKYPDPAKYFLQVRLGEISEIYKNHVLYYLINEDFLRTKIRTIKRICLSNQFQYHIVYNILESNFKNEMAKTKRVPKLTLLENIELDEEFYIERWYTQNSKQIDDYISSLKLSKQTLFEIAKLNNDIHTCGCCFNEEVFFEDMAACPLEGHLFCKECITKSVQIEFGNGKTRFRCLEDKCNSFYTFGTLKNFIDENLLSKAFLQMFEDDLKQTGENVIGLLSCPFCPYWEINEREDTNILVCKNTECLKESCKLCKEPSHIPLKCNEIEKSIETRMRTFIEARITQSMLRSCYKCKKSFFKEEGCNKMVCTCGAQMCYICQEPVKNYDHFARENSKDAKCSLYSEMPKLHASEMRAAAIKAKEEFFLENQDIKIENLKFDPIKLIDEFKEKRKKH